VNGRQVLWLVAIAGVALWLWKSGKISKEPTPSPVPAGSAASAASAPGSGGQGCLTAAEDASRKTQEAANVLLRTPIDPAAFSSASDGASSAISSAEGKCGGGGSTAEQRAMEEARGALSEMRALLSDFSAALSGSGSASDAPRRRESIDMHLDAARAALRG
jgi:hypothetical protein